MKNKQKQFLIYKIKIKIYYRINKKINQIKWINNNNLIRYKIKCKLWNNKNNLIFKQMKSNNKIYKNDKT